MSDLLHQLLYSMTEFRFQAQVAHWNVEGKDFSQLHSFFGDLYTALDGSLDEIAERIRTLDEVVKFDTRKLCDGSNLVKPDDSTNPESLLRTTLTNNSIILSILNSCMREANDKSLFGLQDFISGMIDVHEKHQWMIKVHLK